MKAANEILAELVALKHIKDTQGKTPEYLERQPKAWEDAREYVATGGLLPIESAPKDGTHILLYCSKHKEFFVGFWAVCLDDNDATWVIMRVDNIVVVCRDATHFQYLPQPPKGESK